MEHQIRELFDNTFTTGMVEYVLDIPEFDRRDILKLQTRDRVARPTINDWYYVISKWVRDEL